MSEVRQIRQVSDYFEYIGAKVQHPLVSVVCFDELPEIRHSLNSYEVYGFFLHETSDIELSMGIGQYHYTKDSVICVQPGRIGGKPDNGTTAKLTGWALMFHPTLLAGTGLGKKISQYSVYTYPTNEALTLDPYERNIIVSIIRSIKVELEERKRDKDWQNIIVNYIELILNYCQRAFNHHYHVNPNANENDRIFKLYHLLNQYYGNNLQEKYGLPTVSFCSDKLHITPNYLGDIVRQATGISALNYIHRFIIAKAKAMLLNGESISETAYQLGFEYPQHLNRMFKKAEGMTPTEYIESLNSD
ncbi:MAG: AraC family transcriptional regulator [Bacteroidaceae bacterium]|nr:AraC family transcriptional regulator [Bacteroidaceae bacterium]